MSEKSKLNNKNLVYRVCNSSTTFKTKQNSVTDTYSYPSSSYKCQPELHVSPERYEEERLNKEGTKSLPKLIAKKREHFFLPPLKSKGKIMNVYSAEPKNAIVNEEYKDRLTRTIRFLLQPVIEQEHIKYNELKSALERMERNMEDYFKTTKKLTEQTSDQDQNKQILNIFDRNDNKIRDPSKKHEIKDPLELQDKKDPSKHSEITAPAYKNEKIEDPRTHNVAIAKNHHEQFKQSTRSSSSKQNDGSAKNDKCKKIDTDPCKSKKKDSSTDKKKPVDPSKKKKEEPPKKKTKDLGKKNEKDPCKEKGKKDPGKKKEEDPCKKKGEDPSKRKEDPRKKKKEDPCKKKDDQSKKKEDPCKKKEEDPCKKKEEDPCKKKEEDPCKKKEEDPCKKKEEDPCKKKKEDPCKKKEEDPCKKKEDDPCKKKEDDPCKKKEEDPCKKKEEDPCKKKDEDPCKQEKKDPCEKEAQDKTKGQGKGPDTFKAVKPKSNSFGSAGKKSMKTDPCEAQDTNKVGKEDFNVFKASKSQATTFASSAGGSNQREKFIEPLKSTKTKSNFFVSAGDKKDKDGLKTGHEDVKPFRITKSKADAFAYQENVHCKEDEETVDPFKKSRSKSASFTEALEASETCEKKRVPCIDPCKKQRPCSAQEPTRQVHVSEAKKTEKLQQPCRTDFPKSEIKSSPLTKVASPPTPMPKPKKKCPPIPPKETRYCNKPKPVEYKVEPVSGKALRRCPPISRQPPPLKKVIEPKQQPKKTWLPVKLKAKGSSKKKPSCSNKGKSKSEPYLLGCQPPKPLQPKMDNSKKGFLDGCKGLLSSMCKMICPGKSGSGKKGAAIGAAASQSMPELRTFSHNASYESKRGMKRKAFRDKYPWKRSENVFKEEEEREVSLKEKDAVEARAVEEEEAETFPKKLKENFMHVEKKESSYKPRKLSFAAQATKNEEEETRFLNQRRFPQKFTITGKKIKISLKKPVTRKLCMKMTAHGDTHKRNRFTTYYRMYSDKTHKNEQGECFDSYEKAKEERQKKACEEKQKKECSKKSKKKKKKSRKSSSKRKYPWKKSDKAGHLKDCTSESFITQLCMKKKSENKKTKKSKNKKAVKVCDSVKEEKSSDDKSQKAVKDGEGVKEGKICEDKSKKAGKDPEGVKEGKICDDASKKAAKDCESVKEEKTCVKEEKSCEDKSKKTVKVCEGVKDEKSSDVKSAKTAKGTEDCAKENKESNEADKNNTKKIQRKIADLCATLYEKALEKKKGGKPEPQKKYQLPKDDEDCAEETKKSEPCPEQKHASKKTALLCASIEKLNKKASQLSGNQPQVQKPQPDAKQPEPCKKEASASKEGVPASKEGVPACKEVISAPKLGVPVPASKQDVHACKEKISAPKKDIAASKEKVPAAKEKVPASKEGVPACKEKISAPKKDIAASKEKVPASTNQTKAEVKSKPSEPVAEPCKQPKEEAKPESKCAEGSKGHVDEQPDQSISNQCASMCLKSGADRKIPYDEDKETCTSPVMLMCEERKIGRCKKLVCKPAEKPKPLSEMLKVGKASVKKPSNRNFQRMLKCKVIEDDSGKEVLICKEIDLDTPPDDPCVEKELDSSVEEILKANNGKNLKCDKKKYMLVSQRMVCKEAWLGNSAKKKMRCSMLQVKEVKTEGEQEEEKAKVYARIPSPFTYKDLLKQSEKVRKAAEEEAKAAQKEGKEKKSEC